MDEIIKKTLLLIFLFIQVPIFCRTLPNKNISERLDNYSFFDFNISMCSSEKYRYYYERILKNNKKDGEYINFCRSKYDYFLKNIDDLWSAEPKIPKIIHQIWLGPKPFPEKYKKLRESWMHKNPGWIYKLWTEEDVEKLDLVNKEFYYKTTSWAEKANIVRYEILYRFGGLYIDTDYECLKSIDFLNHCCDFYAGLEYPPAHYNVCLIGNALIAAKPEHPILAAVVAGIKNSWDIFQPWNRINQLERTGTRYFSRIVKKIIAVCEGSNIIFPANIFYPWGYNGGAIPVESLGIHHWDVGWLKDYVGSQLEFEGVSYIFPTFYKAMLCNPTDKACYNEIKNNLFFKFIKRVYKNHVLNSMDLAKEVRIPKIIHQIWVGPYKPPKEFEDWKETWCKHHPDWQYILWTEEKIAQLELYNKKYIEEEKNFGAKADILRYEIIYQFGGLYIDVDFECLKSFDFLHHAFDFYASFFEGTRWRGNVRMPNGIFAATKHHPIVQQLVLEVQNFRHEKDLLNRVGPNYFTAIVQRALPLVQGINIILPSNFFFSWSKGILYPKPETLAIHHYTGTWNKDYAYQQRNQFSASKDSRFFYDVSELENEDCDY